jgi:adenylate kinase
MDDGNLVPDTVVIDMVEDKIATTDAKGFIFDGFPRTVPQAKALDEMLEHHDTAISGMLSLDVPDNELRTRLLERGKTSGRADDQNVDKINNRIQVYKDETLPVCEFYDHQNKYSKIHGVGTVDGIFSDISNAIDNL